MSRGNAGNHLHCERDARGFGAELQVVLRERLRHDGGGGWRERSADADVADSGCCADAVPARRDLEPAGVGGQSQREYEPDKAGGVVIAVFALPGACCCIPFTHSC